MVKRILRYNGEMPYFELIVYASEWQKYVPDRWLEVCGLHRCCQYDKIKPYLPRRVIRELEDAGFAPWCKSLGGNFWFFLRLYRNRNLVCLSPWPKRLVRRLV